MSPTKSHGPVILPVFRLDALNRILKDPEADPAATARALLWIPNIFEDLPPDTHLTPRAISLAELRRLDPQRVAPRRLLR